jgi:hypothetical protein
MPSAEGIQTPLPPSAFARLATAARYAITGVAPTTWFGPQQPLAPMAPPEVKGRQFDYPFGINIDYSPRSTTNIGFAELRALADALPLLRTIIETRKDQIAGTSFSVRLRDPAGDAAAAAARIKSVLGFLERPDRRHSFAAWLRMLLEDMLVIDAATIYPRLTRAGALYSLDIIDGSTITPLVGEDGRAPEAPDPAYQQILHGIPAADFSSDELLYLPRNGRAHRLYGMSPVEQIALTINIALRRDTMTLEYYRAGSAPDSFATLPKEWTVDQIGQFQDYFDALMAGQRRAPAHDQIHAGRLPFAGGTAAAFGAGVQMLSACATYNYTPSGAGSATPIAAQLVGGLPLDLGLVSAANAVSDDFGSTIGALLSAIDLGGTP